LVLPVIPISRSRLARSEGHAEQKHGENEDEKYPHQWRDESNVPIEAHFR